jgi:hypothetical protein
VNVCARTATIAMTNCSAAGATLDRLPLLPGYWRQSASSRIVRPCNDKQNCAGGDEPGDASCHAGHAGPLCDCTVAPLELKCRRRTRSDGLLPTTLLLQYVSGSLCTLADAVTSASLAQRRAIRR